MLKPATLSIYESSAGSGKTYSLVKEYITLVLVSENIYAFKNFIAITFTNKAAYEIKKRILETLQQLSTPSKAHRHPFFGSLLKDTNCTCEQLINRSKLVLGAILHSFSDFSISTIDKFTHKIIRTFASNFSLNSNFELETQSHILLKKALENFLFKISPQSSLRNFLTDFSLYNLHQGDNWDPSISLLESANLLIQKDNTLFLQRLQKHKLSDFYDLKKYLICQMKSFERSLILEAKKYLKFIEEKHISFDSFYHLDWPNTLKKIIEGNYIINPFNKRLQRSICSGKLYSKTFKNDTQKKLINNHCQEILRHYKSLSVFYQKGISKYLTARILLKNLSAIAVIYEIDKELNILKKEKNIVLIEELNEILGQFINSETSSYIYEYLGERYTYYFIDEFQDTSLMQWKNFEPLIENALAQGGAAMIVGDIKQSIYRWRGAHPEQFLSLSQNNKAPYKIEVYSLKKNFRSFKNIVSFNNEFYSIIADLLSNPFYKKAYKENFQDYSEKHGGYIELNFISSNDNCAYYYTTYNRVLKCIKKLLLHGYKYSDICLLVRKKKQGAFLATSLIADHQPVISSESLSLTKISTVKIILGYLKVISKPEDINSRIDWSLLLLQYGLFNPKVKDVHYFLEFLTKLSFEGFFKKLTQLGLSFKGYLGYHNYSLYELCEEVIRVGQLNRINDINSLIFFLNTVYRAMRKGIFTPIEFLKWWDQRQDKESVSFYESLNAIKIMTIHQAKGLEFPIVLLPFANWNTFEEKKGGLWLEIDGNEYKGFDLLYATANTFMKSLEGSIKERYEDYLSKIQFDHINLLYVATTRAIERLFIFSRRSKTQTSTIAFYLEYYLKKKSYWDPSKEVYELGSI